MVKNILRLTIVLSVAAALAACSGDTAPEPARADDGKNGGLLESLFGSSDPPRSGSTITVNSFLWRASLDTVSFLPLSSADPFGGVIISDWYSPPETPDERFKVTVYILDRQLRADGLRVSVFRQRRNPDGGWIEARVDERTSRDLENAILKRARQMRVRLNEQ
jgi:hypothetical protein